LGSLDGRFVAGSTRAAASTRFVMRELVSMRDGEGAFGAGVAVDRTKVLRRSPDRRTALGCTKVTVSTRASVAGPIVFSAAR
jgi:hypothetical protein